MKRVSTLTLHRYRNGELSPEEAAVVRAALEANPEDMNRLRAQQALRQEFQLRPVPPALKAPPARGLWARWSLPAFAMAAALSLVVLLPSSPPPGEMGSEITRAKGQDRRIDVLVEGHGLLDAGELLRPGDRVQLRLAAGPYVEAWVSDGTKVLGRFDTAADRPTLAPFSLTLDDAPGDEHVVVLLARDHLEPAAVPALLGADSANGVERVSLRLPKVR